MKRIILTLFILGTLLWAPSRADYEPSGARDDAEDGIYSRAEEGSYTIPPELYHMKKTQTSKEMDWIVNREEFGIDPAHWQSDPSRIIYFMGRYHMWMINMDMSKDPEAIWWFDKDFFKRPEGLNLRKRFSRILYLSSKDTYHWTAHGYVPTGPEGSCYDLALEQANVVYHEGKFYLFTEVWTTNVNKYGQHYPGITCLVADDPGGPWSLLPGVDLLLRPSLDNGKSFDSHRILNPRHVYLNGRWFMYYKGIRKEGVPTQNGVAIADDITGPYRKYEGNPLMKGHGHFCFSYKHGMVMIPNYDHADPAKGKWIHWSEDGIHFAPVCKSKDAFLFGSLYVPGGALFGEGATGESGTGFWGFESVRKSNRGEGSFWDVERIEWKSDVGNAHRKTNQ